MRDFQLFILFFILTSGVGFSQENEVYHHEFIDYDRGIEFYDSQLYGQAIDAMREHLALATKTEEADPDLTKDIHARSIIHISELRLSLPEALPGLKRFVDGNHIDPHAGDAVYELADYFYNDQQYSEAIEYFDLIDLESLPEEKMSELIFKKGYCYFVKKEFQQAQYTFANSKDIQNRFFYPINYYNGMCDYFNEDYDGAIKSFRRVENSLNYKDHIPYYISQIYFAEEKYNDLISYGEKVISQPGTKNKKEIRLLLGQTYFQNNNFEKALPHLEYYEQNTDQLTVEEFYQLAFTQYQLGYCDRAISNFLQINREKTKVGQVVNYYLADCYEKNGDMQSSRAAFKMVSDMDFDQGMKEEATFNYGKLSAQMGMEREAINVLMDVPKFSPFYGETQNIINDILLNTGDFENAITILESLDVLNPELEKTYQKVTFNQAIQSLSDGDTEKAKQMFEKSNTYTYDKSLIAQAAFWNAMMASSEQEYDQSTQHFDNYFTISQNVNLPEESAPYLAHYYQGYNYLKTNNYNSAANSFKESIQGINRNDAQIRNVTTINRVLPDAYLRAGDCLFKQNNYDSAVTFYDQSIDRQANGYEYAKYQRGIIEGLVGEPYQKIITMEDIVDNHDESDYHDDAMYQLGETYMSIGSMIPAANTFRNLRDTYRGRSNLINAANLKLGLINYNEGDVEGALAYYKSVFSNNPSANESQEALIAIEEIYIDDLGKSDEYFSFLGTIPGYEVSAFAKDSINFRIGEIQYQNGNYDRAVIAFDDYLKIYDQGYYRLNARYFRAESNSILKKYNRALPDYENIIKEGISDFYNNSLKKAAIISYNYNQNFNKAYNYYSKWSSHTTDLDEQYEAQLGSMRSAFRISNNDAVQKYSDLVMKNPIANGSDRATAKYFKAKVNYNLGQYTTATTLFKDVAQSTTNNQAAESRYMLAMIAYKNGNLSEAETLVNSANEKNTNYPNWIAKSLLLLSDIYLDRDEVLNARASVEAVLENFQSDDDINAIATKQLQKVEAKEAELNRIKSNDPNGNLELDTNGN